MNSLYLYPGVGQLVDDMIWVHEASGSSPDTWTNKTL